MEITIEAKSPYGVMSQEKWYNFVNKDDIKKMEVGKAYVVTLEDVKCADGKTRKQVTKFKSVAKTEAKEVKNERREATDTAVTERNPVKESTAARENKATDWAAKDRSQLVGGRSHDAVELVKASLVNATPMPKVLELYKEALNGVLKLADEIK